MCLHIKYMYPLVVFKRNNGYLKGDSAGQSIQEKDGSINSLNVSCFIL